MSELIRLLIKINCEIWHTATKIKTFDGVPNKNNLSSEERVACFMKVRELNAERSRLRWEIDSYFGCGANETKTNYHIKD